MSKGVDQAWPGFSTLEDLDSECAIVQRIFCFGRVIDPIVGTDGELR